METRRMQPDHYSSIVFFQFLHVSVSHSVHGGRCAIPACIAGGIPACLQRGGVCSQGCLLQEGACSQGGCVCFRGLPAPGGGVWAPESRWLLLWMVHILLECILVFKIRLIRLGFSFKKLKIHVLYLNS